MEPNKKARILCASLMLSGCSAVGFVKTSDPEIRLHQAFQLMEQDRALMAEDFIRQSMAQAVEAGDPELIAEAHHSFGALYRHPSYHRHAHLFEKVSEYDGTYEKALFHYELAIEYIQKSGSEIGVVKSIVGKGMTYDDRDEREKACEQYGIALDVYRREKAKGAITSEPVILDRCFENMGEIIEGYRYRERCDPQAQSGSGS